MVVSSSDLFAAGAEVGQNGVDAVLVDGAQRVRGNLQLDPAVFAGDPEAALVQVRQEAAAGLVVGVRDVVASLHALAGNLAYAGHNAPRKDCLSPLARGTAAPPPALQRAQAVHDCGCEWCCRWRVGIVLPGPPGHGHPHGAKPTGRSEPGIMTIDAGPGKHLSTGRPPMACRSGL